MAELYDLVPAHKNREVTAAVAKWFTDIGAQEIVHVLGVYGSVKVAEAGKTIILKNESDAEDFLTIALDVADANINYTFPYGLVVLAKGKDIKATTNATTGKAELNIVIGKRT